MPKHVKSLAGEPCTTRGCLRCEDLWFERREQYRTTSAFGFTEINLFGVTLWRTPPGHPRGGKCRWCDQEAPIELIGRVTGNISGYSFTRNALTCALHFTRAIDYVHWFYYPESRTEVRTFYDKHYRLAHAA